MMDMILQYLLPVIVAAVVSFGMKMLKAASDWVAALSDTKKRVVLGGIALLAALGSKLVGIELPADLLGMDAGLLSTLVNTGLTALIAHFLHKGTNAVTA